MQHRFVIEIPEIAPLLLSLHLKDTFKVALLERLFCSEESFRHKVKTLNSVCICQLRFLNCKASSRFSLHEESEYCNKKRESSQSVLDYSAGKVSLLSVTDDRLTQIKRTQTQAQTNTSAH